MSQLACIIPLWRAVPDPLRDAALARVLKHMVEQEIPVFLACPETVKPQLSCSSRLLSMLSLPVSTPHWPKERLINAAVAMLPPDVDGVLWLDGDVLLSAVPVARRSPPAALSETTIHHPLSIIGPLAGSLSTHCLAQAFQRFWFLDAAEHAIAAGPGMAHSFQRGGHDPGALQANHTGFAWLARRSLWTHGPGLYRDGVTGWGDVVIALAALDRLESHPWHLQFSTAWRANQLAYARHLRAWMAAEYAIEYKDGRPDRTGVGAAPLIARHLWHGSHQSRGYRARVDAVKDGSPPAA